MNYLDELNEKLFSDSVKMIQILLKELKNQLDLDTQEKEEFQNICQKLINYREDYDRYGRMAMVFRLKLNDTELPSNIALSEQDMNTINEYFDLHKNGDHSGYLSLIEAEGEAFNNMKHIMNDLKTYEKSKNDYISEMERAMERQDDSGFWTKMAQEAADPEIQDYCFEIHEINESVENSRAYARSVDKEFREAEAQADRAIEQAEELIYAKEDKLADIQNSLLNPESTKESSFADKMVKDILKDMNVASNLNTKDNKDLAKGAVTAAHRSVAEHPLRYTMQGIIHQLRQTKAEINESRRYMIETEGGYNNALAQAKNAVLAKVNPVVEPIKGVVMTTARETVITLGSITSAAYEKFAELGEKGCNLLEKGYKSLVKGTACILEACTFGAYSVINDKLCDKLKDLAAKYNTSGKNSPLVFIAHKAQITQESYANEIHDTIWGKDRTSPFDDIVNFTKSTVKGTVNFAKSAVEQAGDNVVYKAYTTKEGIQNALNSALDKVQETAEKVTHDINVQLVQLKADSLGIEAFIAEKQAAFCEKYERRLATKIEKIEKADRAIDDTLANIKKEMESLKGAITAYKREPYTPSKHVMDMLAILKNEVPTNQIAAYIHNLEKAIAQDKELYEQEGAKELAVLYLKYEDKCAEYEEAVEKAKETKEKHLDKMEKALEKLDKTAQMRENLEKDSQNNTAEAIQMVMDAKDNTKNSKENDSQDFDRDDM